MTTRSDQASDAQGVGSPTTSPIPSTTAPDSPPQPPITAQERLWGAAVARFLGNVQRPATDSACWAWTGYTDVRGYGQLRVVDQTAYAHRFSYLLHVGPIPPGLDVLQTCEDRACVNPGHLVLGSTRARSAGERSRNAKLTEAQVLAILADDRPNTHVAADYGVSDVIVSKVRRGKAWAHLSGATAVLHDGATQRHARALAGGTAQGRSQGGAEPAARQGADTGADA